MFHSTTGLLPFIGFSRNRFDICNIQISKTQYEKSLLKWKLYDIRGGLEPLAELSIL